MTHRRHRRGAGLAGVAPDAFACFWRLRGGRHSRPLRLRAVYREDALTYGSAGTRLRRGPAPADSAGPAAGDWLSGRAPRSHRGGHWFDPSIAHQLRGYVDLRQDLDGSHSCSQVVGDPVRAMAGRRGWAKTVSTSVTWRSAATSRPIGIASAAGVA